MEEYEKKKDNSTVEKKQGMDYLNIVLHVIYQYLESFLL
jgi:hypothetical protein